MKEYLLKQPKATCVLFFIACKINLGLVKKKKNGNLGGRGGGGLWPRKSEWEGGVKKPCHLSGEGVWIFSGITHLV